MKVSLVTLKPVSFIHSRSQILNFFKLFVTMYFHAVLLLIFIFYLFRMTHGLMMDLIVAVDAAGGIGKNGIIPWKLRKDMDHFVKKTSGDNDPSQVPPKVLPFFFCRKIVEIVLCCS